VSVIIRPGFDPSVYQHPARGLVCARLPPGQNLTKKTDRKKEIAEKIKRSGLGPPRWKSVEKMAMEALGGMFARRGFGLWGRT